MAEELKVLDVDYILEMAHTELNQRNTLKGIQSTGLLFLPSSFQNVKHIQNAIAMLQSFIDFIESEE